MRIEPQRKLARRTALVAAAIAAICIGWLLSTHLAARLGAPAEQAEVQRLVEQVKSDAAVAGELLEERERQTEASLRRKTGSRVAAWILLVAAAGFVAAGKWHDSLSPAPLPVLERLVDLRFGPSGGGATRQGPRPDRLLSIEPALDLTFVDELVQRFGRGQEAAIPILQAIQDHYRYLPDEALQRVCVLTEIVPAQLAGTSSFYAQFRRSPVGRHVVRICHGTACHVAGADQIEQELRRHLDIPAGADTDAGRHVTLDTVACVGCCSLAPVLMVGDEAAGRLSAASARQVVDDVVAS